jgi:hypothetical protein
MAPLCRDCGHFRDQNGGKCGHPNVAVSLIDGTLVLRSAERMREWDGPCGTEGRLWDSAAAARVVNAEPAERKLPAG